MSTAAAARKAEQRLHWRRQRKQAMTQVAADLTAAVHAGLRQLQRPGRLGLFWPLGAEARLLDPAPSWPGGLALPRTEASGLVYVPWQPGAALTGDHCGIPAPGGMALAPEQLGLLLVPALACSSDGMRLGSGGGWYDRLRAQPAWRAVPALMVLPQCCCNVRLAVDPWDVPFSGWITEQGMELLEPLEC